MLAGRLRDGQIQTERMAEEPFRSGELLLSFLTAVAKSHKPLQCRGCRAVRCRRSHYQLRVVVVDVAM